MSEQSLQHYDEATCTFVVWGKAVPRGSTKALPRGRRVIHDVDGNRYREDKGSFIIDQESESLKSWMQQVKQTAISEWGIVRNRYSDGPFKIEIIFRLDRPKTHFRSGRFSDSIKISAPKYPIVRPDIDKLTRAILDALTGIVYKDDSQVVELDVKKRYGYPEGVKIKIHEL